MVVRVLPPGITPWACAKSAADFEPGAAQRRVSASACGDFTPVVGVMGAPPTAIIVERARLWTARDALWQTRARPRMKPLGGPDALTSTDDLAARLGPPGLRVYDCTTYLEPPDPGSDDPYKAVAGWKTFVAGHIPGADFLDLQEEFSATDTKLKFMMPPAEPLARAFGRHGLGDGARVVLYSIGTMMWATRFWWMLRSLGFDGAAVLDGGFDRWQAEGRPIESGRPQGYPQTEFKAEPRRAAGAGAGQRQCPGGHARRRESQRFHDAHRCGSEVRDAGRNERPDR